MNILIDQNQLYVGQKVYIVLFANVAEDVIETMEVNKTGGYVKLASYDYISFRFEKRENKWLIIPKSGYFITFDRKQALQWAIDYHNKLIKNNKTEIQKLEGNVLESEEIIKRYTEELSTL